MTGRRPGWTTTECHGMWAKDKQMPFGHFCFDTRHQSPGCDVHGQGCMPGSERHLARIKPRERSSSVMLGLGHERRIRKWLVVGNCLHHRVTDRATVTEGAHARGAQVQAWHGLSRQDKAPRITHQRLQHQQV
eukprot:7193138-Prymnesium_polylepis.2